MDNVKIYKTLITTLKYRTEEYKLIADEEGYYSVSDVLKVIRKLHPEYKYITAFHLRDSAICDVKKRVEITKDLKRIKIK